MDRTLDSRVEFYDADHPWPPPAGQLLVFESSEIENNVEMYLWMLNIPLDTVLMVLGVVLGDEKSVRGRVEVMDSTGKIMKILYSYFIDAKML